MNYIHEDCTTKTHTHKVMHDHGHRDFDSVINQVRNRLWRKGRWTNHLWSQVVGELVLVTCLKRDDGTKGRWDEGTMGRRDDGTKG